MSDTGRRQRPTGARIATAAPEKTARIECETISQFSHQLRSLLTSIGAAADYLLTNDTEQGVQDEMLGIITEQSSRIDGLLDDFLVIAREGPSRNASASPVNLYHITRQAVQALAGEAQSVGAWLVLDAAGTIPPVVGQHKPLQQAVTGALRELICLARPGERVVARLEDARSHAGQDLVVLSVLIQSEDPRLHERADALAPGDMSVAAARRICESHGGSLVTLDDTPGVACRLPVATIQLGPADAIHPDRRCGAGGQ